MEKRRETWLTIGILVVVFGLVVNDVFSDISAGTTWIHVASECLIAVFALVLLYRLIKRARRLEGSLRKVSAELETSRIHAQEWKQKNEELLKGLSRAIDEQLEKWGLSPAEKEIALLILKGLSLKEIAEVRATSERTVRQQTLAIYSKSGLAGRAELSAFFLEDLLS